MTWLQLIPLFALLVTLTGAMIGAAWKLSDVATKVQLILTNHLPHIDADIKELRGELLQVLTLKGR
jgi:hypothetical protein